jgi:hypothetical protein
MLVRERAMKTWKGRIYYFLADVFCLWNAKLFNFFMDKWYAEAYDDINEALDEECRNAEIEYYSELIVPEENWEWVE